MLDFRYKVFYAVARNLSFTKAAHELFITQPAVTKHIKELESLLELRLFERSGTKISLTDSGRVLADYCKSVLALDKQLSYDLGLLKEKVTGSIRVGASTTIAQYVLPPVLAAYHERFPDIKINLLSGNTQYIEDLLIKGEIDVGVVEGVSHRTELQYKTLLKDELILVCHRNNTKVPQKEISLNDLKTLPLVVREPGSGTFEVIEYALEKKKVKTSDLSIVMKLGSPESIKSFLSHSSSFAFLSKLTVEQELANGVFKQIGVRDLQITRSFQLITLIGQTDRLSERFQRFLMNYYNFK